MPKKPEFRANRRQWLGLSEIPQKSYKCGFCGDKVSSNKGLVIRHSTTNGSTRDEAGLAICPECWAATFFYPGTFYQFPNSSFGNVVNHLPKGIHELFEEARVCTSNNNFTASVLLSRKILMHIAVEQGAPEGKNFMSYVDYLVAQGYVPPNGKHWVDHIRKKGNEANHEIAIMTPADAQELITFLEMLLRFIYEFPNSIPKPPGEPQKS